jgi:hypothetical protein
VCALLGVAFVAACGDSGPQVPTTLESGATITTLAAAAATQATVVPSVTLRDARGNGIAGIWVHFAVTGGGKLVNDSAATTKTGNASAGTWTLGPIAGVQTVIATAAGLPPITFVAQVAAGPAARVVRVAPDSQRTTVNTATALPPSVQVVDQYDNPVQGVAVTFVAAGGAMTGAQKTTGTNGVATADSWTLGTAAGAQLGHADVAGLASAAFSAVALAAKPARIVAVSGSAASGVAHASLSSFALLPSVRVTDSYDNPVAGVTVTFTPAANSGSVSGAAAVTNDAGIATLSDWVLGSAANESIIATSTAVVGMQVVFTVTVSSSQFDIAVRYVDGVPSERQQLAVSRAVEKWKSVITSNSGTSKVVLTAGACGRSWMPAINETVTNVLILAKIGPIDGVGNILGNANSCVLHSTGAQLSVLGTMYFDSDDLASLEGNGLIDVVILHEMGHVLGIGSQWASKSLITERGGSDPIFTGANALAQFAAIGGASYSGRPVPVENRGGNGTADVHWRKSVLRNELMTGYLNIGSNPLSRVTVASLQDLGYSVLLSGADSFSLASSLLANPFAASVSLGNDLLPTTLMTMDRNGKRGVPLPRGN